MLTIGIIGLGHMGTPMAKNLLKAGFSVMVYDLQPILMDTLVMLGAIGAESLKDMAQHSDVIITMLQTGNQVSEVCLNEVGLFTNAKPGLLYIDCSSIDIITTRELHARADQYSIQMLDAPVSGGTKGAELGTLTFMVGGSEVAFNQANPILTKMGKKIIYAGFAGSGQAAKICNNLLLGISMVGVCEAFVLGQKLGLDAKKFFEIGSHASSQCWAMTSYCPLPDILPDVPANHNYEPGFMAKMMLKDLRLGHHAAENVGAFIPLGAQAAELYAMFVNQGHGELDFSAIINLIKGNL